jgi:hypothetical protein
VITKEVRWEFKVMQEPSKSQDPSQDTGKFPESMRASDPPKIAETLKVVDTARLHEPSRPADTLKIVDTARPTAGPKVVHDPRKITPPPVVRPAAIEAAAQKMPNTGKSETWLSPLVLALATTLGLGVAFWSFMSPTADQAAVDEARAKLTATTDELKGVRDAKVAVERTLEETRAKLTVEQKARAIAEKAVVDAKAALSAVPLAVSATEPAPKQ